MDWWLLWTAVILGLVEGITEFIPVSSTGHLILAGHLLGFTDERAKVFEVFIQLGAILAIVWLYRRKVAETLTGFWKPGPGQRLVVNLLVAFLPAAVVGLLTNDYIKDRLFNPVTVSIALVVGGVAILAVERWKPRPRVMEVDEVPLRTALGIGLAQVLALFPGVSRSGATIMGAYSLGLSRTAATEFSFFLAVPVMFAATLFDLLDSRELLTAADVPLFSIGFAVSFVSALVVVKAFLRFVSTNSFAVFAWYRIVLGLALLAYFGLNGFPMDGTGP
jgi:undecaprenyl-diphosphatase